MPTICPENSVEIWQVDADACAELRRLTTQLFSFPLATAVRYTGRESAFPTCLSVAQHDD